MMHLRRAALLLDICLLSSASAQLLTYGSGALPTCAQQCTLLNQGQSACVPPAAPASTLQGYWGCFCQSAYIRTLYTSPNGVCDAVCKQPDLVTIQNWYKSSCGTDNGQSEHAGGTTTSSASSTAGATATSPPRASSGSSSGGETASNPQPAENGSWWSNHGKWIIMTIVLILGFIMFALLGLWLKRRHARKQDDITSGFNEGITTRTTPMASVTSRNALIAHPVANPDGAEASNGKDTPTRTRDAFMPYGYGYSRSESRLAREGRRGPGQPRGSTPDNEKEIAAAGGHEAGRGSKRKMVDARERDVERPRGSEMEQAPPI